MIRRRAGLVGMVIGLASGVAGTVRVHLSRTTITRIVSVVRVILGTVSGELCGVLRQVLRCMLRR